MRSSALVIACGGLIACSGSGGSSGPSDGGSDVEPDAFTYENCLPDCDVPYESFFDPSRLATIRLDIDERILSEAGYAREEWLDYLRARWHHCGPYDNYVPVTLTYEHEESGDFAELPYVGMRIRGTGDEDMDERSRTGFKLHLSTLLPEPPEGTPRRHFADLNRINILSIERDASAMVQCLVYQMMNQFGIPAPRCNHVRVYVNGAYYGLMQNAEEPDDGRYVRHRFDDSGGTLYEANHDCGNETATPLAYMGDTYLGSQYETAYFIEVGDPADGQAQLVPMLACADPTITPDDGDFATCIAEWIDLDEWLRVIAAEMVLPNAESVAGIGRNFYLYFYPDATAPHGGRFQVYSWDMDGSFWVTCNTEPCSIFDTKPNWFTGETPPLITRLRDVFRAEYCAAVQGFLDTSFKVERVDAIASVIQDSMVPGGKFVDTDPTISAADWMDRVDDLRGFVGSWRLDELEPQLAACP